MVHSESPSPRVHSTPSQHATLALPAIFTHIIDAMSQQPAEVHAHDAPDAGNREDLPWVFHEIACLVMHKHHTCACCERHLDHYRKTGMDLDSASFQSACRLEEGQVRKTLQSTNDELDMLWGYWNVVGEDLKGEIYQATRELEAIRREREECSWEFKRLSQELKEVWGEVASFRHREARLVDEVSGLTTHAPQLHQSQLA